MTILSNGHQWKYSEFTDNNNYSFNKKQILTSLSSKEIDDAYESISKWKGYAPTPLILLNNLSEEFHKVKSLANKGIEVGDVKLNLEKMMKSTWNYSTTISK